MRLIIPFLAGLFVLGAFSGCLGAEDGAAKSGLPVLRRAVPVINLNVSLLDTARFAADERFGPDRPLTLKDIPDLLPRGLTNYDITLNYVLNMSLYPNIQTIQIGESLTGRAIFGLVLTDDGQFHADRPSIMLTCSQHGNEPSGSEACLIFIEYFTHGVDDLAVNVRTKLNILVNPLANPDGKEGNRRGNYDQVDINRDHMNLATLEGRAIHEFYNRFNPEFGLDLHEFGGVGQAPPGNPTPVTTWNTFQVAGPEGVAEDDPNLFLATNELLRHVALRSSEKYKFGSTSYYFGGTSVGAYPSVHRHHFALRNSFSLLFETGGGGGVVNLPLRVDHQVTATFAVVEWLFLNQQRAVSIVQQADRDAQQASRGVQGWLIPPQKDSAKAEFFLRMHGQNYTRLDKDATYMVQDYRTSAQTVPSQKSFANGTLVVSRWQADGRLSYELFENTEDPYYVKGPRSWPLEAYRIVSLS